MMIPKFWYYIFIDKYKASMFLYVTYLISYLNFEFIF